MNTMGADKGIKPRDASRVTWRDLTWGERWVDVREWQLNRGSTWGKCFAELVVLISLIVAVVVVWKMVL